MLKTIGLICLYILIVFMVVIVAESWNADRAYGESYRHNYPAIQKMCKARMFRVPSMVKTCTNVESDAADFVHFISKEAKKIHNADALDIIKACRVAKKNSQDFLGQQLCINHILHLSIFPPSPPPTAPGKPADPERPYTF